MAFVVMVKNKFSKGFHAFRGDFGEKILKFRSRASAERLARQIRRATMIRKV